MKEYLSLWYIKLKVFNWVTPFEAQLSESRNHLSIIVAIPIKPQSP
jgi:hypothetical protein